MASNREIRHPAAAIKALPDVVRRSAGGRCVRPPRTAEGPAIHSRLKNARRRLVLIATTLSLVAAGLVTAPAAVATPPLNDAFTTATALPESLPLTVAGTNVDATSEPSEPLDGGAFSGSVWY